MAASLRAIAQPRAEVRIPLQDFTRTEEAVPADKLDPCIANIIVVERARSVGVRLTFLEHARCGVPMTLLSLLLALAWLYGVGHAAP
jgi:hypothetical protein